MSKNLTRRQAIPKAIDLLQCLPQTEEVVAVIQALEKYYSTPLARWDVPSVYEALEEWSSKHDGKAPSVKECDNAPQLPSHGVFEKLFHKSAREFLQEHYGAQEYVRIGKHKILCIDNQYDFLEVFKSEFNRIRPTTSMMYDANRKKDAPSWQTIARRCHVANWSDLVTLSGVEASCLSRQYNCYYTENKLVAEHKVNDDMAAEVEAQRRAKAEFDTFIEKTDKIISRIQDTNNGKSQGEKTRTVQIRRK